VRLLYLTRGATALAGREAFAGRRLFDYLAEACDEAVATHVVAPPGRESEIRLELLDRDVLTSRNYLTFDPHVLYFEGGIWGGLDDWRVPRKLLEQSVRSGAVAIVADAEFNELNLRRNDYLAASQFLGAQPNYGADDDLGPSPVYGVDRRTREREFEVTPDRMLVSEWLRPIYDGVERIVGVSPVDLIGGQDILATGDASNTATLQRDVWVDERGYCTFATVTQVGDGFVVFISAAVSHDLIVERAPHNPRWILNTIRFLRGEIANDSRRYAGIRRLQKVFDVVRESPSNPEAESRVNHAFDAEARRALRRESTQAAREQLAEIFGSLWEAMSEEARRQLVAAEIYRHDAEVLVDSVDQLDFSAAVWAYSRAVEMELLRRLFEPYRERPDADELPEPRSEKRDGESLRVLRRHLDGHDPTLGQMAFILMNIGCRLRDEEPNAFAQYLRERLVDFDWFCNKLTRRGCHSARTTMPRSSGTA
jgi:hypothetical protein